MQSSTLRADSSARSASRRADAPVPLRKAIQIPMARSIARRHGYKAAATYLRKRGWSFDAAVWILLDAPAAPAQLQPTLY